jgi:hypothetical protein
MWSLRLAERKLSTLLVVSLYSRSGNRTNDSSSEALLPKELNRFGRKSLK